MARIGLMYGDCLERMKEIPDGYVDLTVTSPPYDKLRTYKNSLEWGEHVWKPTLQDLFRVTKEGGVVVWVVGDATVNGSETGTSFKQALWAMQCGFKLHDTMIWEKPNFSNPSSNRYHQLFEYMFIFVKGKLKTFNPIKDKKNKYTTCLGKNTFRSSEGGMKDRAKVDCGEYGMRPNVWKMNTVGQERVCKRPPHPAMFPEKLAADHILSWSNKGDIVFDPFMGSGQTGRAAVKNGRDFLGIEKVLEYFRLPKPG